jgi:hypothetical protein
VIPESLFSIGFGLAFGHRIDPGREDLASVKVEFARLGK